MDNGNSENPLADLRILLVEDDADDHLIIRHHLSKIPENGFSMDWVTDYDGAMAALESDKYDLCLLDYRLGVHTGLELLEQVANNDWETPIIILTGQGEYEVDIQAMRSGAADYIVKDHLTPTLLERSIRYTLEREKSRKALKKANEELEARVQEKTADLAKANEELRRESERVKMFAYSVSHDLKNPAISLYGLTKRLFDNYGEILDEKGRTHCEHIMKSARQIATLTEQINMFIASKEAPVSVEALNLKEALSNIKNEFAQQLRLRKIHWSEPDDLPVIRGDRVSLDRVFRNLVDNSLKYGGDGLREIRIGFRETALFWIISVSDDGIGIKTKNPDKVFGYFRRIGSEQKADGSGLGLAIVKEIAGKHNGEVWAEPGPLGGASISVSFSKGISEKQGAANTAIENHP